jgi:hypothetical protein
LPFSQDYYRGIIDSLIQDIPDCEFLSDSVTCNDNLTYVSNDSYKYKFNISNFKLLYDVNFANFFDSTVVPNTHYLGVPFSISLAGAYNPNATVPIIARTLSATCFSDFIVCNHHFGYDSFNLRVGDNIGLVCKIISQFVHLGHSASSSGLIWSPRMCTEAASSTFVDFRAPISRDICNFGIDCSIGDVLTYLFNFQEFNLRHIFCNNCTDYSDEYIATIDLDCFKCFDTVFSNDKFDVCFNFKFSDTFLRCTDDPYWHSDCLHAVLYYCTGVHVHDMLGKLPPPPLSPGCPDVPVNNSGGLTHLNNKHFSVFNPHIHHNCILLLIILTILLMTLHMIFILNLVFCITGYVFVPVITGFVLVLAALACAPKI